MNRRARHLSALAALAMACTPETPPPLPTQPAQPNILFVVWDTVRADHLGLYGYPRPTTPRLDAWARDALVFEDAFATASSTVPTHASLFTGLLPSEHGANAGHQRLDGRFDTLAELLRAAGYRTYLWSSNAHITRARNFAQGFDVAEHPWSPELREEASRLVRAKLPPEDRSSSLRQKLGDEDAADWVLSAAGSLAAGRAAQFAAQDPARPWFVFVNYMEAHRPTIPDIAYRRLFLDAAQVARSYQIDHSWPTVWAHVFGLRRYAPGDLEILAGVYDAALRELDDLFAGLLETFAEHGLLGAQTIVVLTADHGELLGEHGLLDHQYSLYQPLVRVPLVLKAPGELAPGRSRAPVMAFDLFPTLLELAGVPAPAKLRSQAVSLRAPRPERARLAEYPAVFERPLRTARRLAPDTDLSRWERRLRAYEKDGLKLIEGEDGRHELYDLGADPGELDDRSASDPATRERLREELFGLVRGLAPAGPPEPSAGAHDAEEARLLRQLGYADDSPPAPTAGHGSSWSQGAGR